MADKFDQLTRTTGFFLPLAGKVTKNVERMYRRDCNEDNGN